MKTSKILLAINFAIYAVSIALFTWFMKIDRHAYADIVKPFVVWSFAVFFCGTAIRFPELSGLAKRLTVVFLFYGVGDVIMEMGTALTPAGIVLFATGHIFYILSILFTHDAPFEKDVESEMKPSSRKALAIVAASIMVIGTTSVVIWIARGTGLYVFCTMAEIYAQMFTTAIIVACLKWRRVSSIVLTILGSAIYAASDICIASQRYMVNLPWMQPFVMVTYWSAVPIYALSFFPVFFDVIRKAGKEKPKEKEQ